MRARIIWLAAGLTSVAAGIGLVLASAVEGGIAFVVLGAGLLAGGGGVRPNPPPTDADATSPDDLTRRIAELQHLEKRLLEGGVSPAERAYHELRLGRDADSGPRAPAGPDDLDDEDRRLAELASRRCERVWEGIRERRYVRSEGGRVTDLDGGAIFAEVRAIVQEVADLCHAQSDNAVLEVRTGDIALAVRSAIGDLLHLVSQIPYVDPAGWSVRSVVERLEQAQKGLELYRKVSPYQPYVNAASVAARLALGANPITLAAWTVGSQVAWRAGEKVVRSYAETWLKDLLETSIALVYVHVARTYDPRRAYRGAEWTALVEALRVHARVPGADHNRKLLLNRILGAQLPDEFAKMTLLRALAADRAPDPRAAPATDLATLRPDERKAVAERLSDLLSVMHGLDAPEAGRAIADLERRLDTRLGIAPPRAGNSAATPVTKRFRRLASFAHDRLGVRVHEARPAAAASHRLRALLQCPEVSTWPKRCAAAIVRQAEAAGAPPVAAFEATDTNGTAEWLLVFTDRVLVGRALEADAGGDDSAAEEYPLDAIRLFRNRGTVADALVVHCGNRRLTVDGSVTRSFNSRFGPMFRLLGRHPEQGHGAS